MEIDDSKPTFRTDALPDDITQDLLNREKFVKTLADKILNFNDPNCLIIGIHGPWGSGKSTFLKFLESEMINIDDDPVIVHFNPWNFVNMNQLITMFFKNIKFAICKGKSARDRSSEIGEILEKLGKILAPIGAIPLEAIPQILPFSPIIKGISSAIEKLGSGIREAVDQDPAELKKDLNQLLAEHGKNIIILIDDIDRLDKEGMRLIFRLIRLNADFINTRYILSFDRKVAERALDEEQGISGREYLEKFIQVPFDLPLPNHKIIADILSKEIQKIIPPAAKMDLESYRGNKLCENFFLFFSTLREVKRYSNSFLLTMPQINEEINYLDFAALESIRIFCPDIYNELPHHKDILLGNKDPFSFKVDIEERKNSIEYIITLEKDIRKQNIVRAIIFQLFPHAGKADRSGDNRDYRKSKRICSSTRFNRYFLLHVPTGEISQGEIDNALKIASDQDAFIRCLKEYNNRNILDQFLGRIDDYIFEMSPEKIKCIVEAFFDVGDELSITNNGLINTIMQMHIGFTILNLVEQIKDPSIRTEIIKNGVKCGKSFYIIFFILFNINKDKNDKQIILNEDLPTINELAAKRIQEKANKDEFAEMINLGSILFHWMELAGSDAPNDFVSNLIENNQGIIRLLVGFVTQSYDDYNGMQYSLRENNFKAIAEFADIPFIYSKLISIKQNEPSLLSDELEKIAAEDFIRLYEKEYPILS